MKNLFNWIPRLGLLIVLAAIAWIVYVNFQQQSGKPLEEHAAQPEQQPQETPEAATPLDTDTQIPTPQPEEKTTTAEIPVADKEKVAEPPSPTSPITSAVTVQLPTTEPAAETETAPAAPDQPVTEALEPAETTAAVPESETEPAAEQPASLQEARMAAWKGQWDKAEAAYRKLQQENPDDFNVHGELGNLYYMQRKGKEAAEAYYQTATLLAAQGYRRDAMRLMQVIQRLDRELGVKLQQELFGGSTNGTVAPSGTESTPSNSP